MTDWTMHRAAQAAEQFAAQAWDCLDRPISQEWTLALMALRDALAALPPDPITLHEPDPLDRTWPAPSSREVND